MPDEDVRAQDAVMEQQYARAGARHYHDAVYLCGDQRWPTADHLFGFAAECALKSLLLRFAVHDVSTYRNGNAVNRARWVDPRTGKEDWLGHINQVLGAAPLLAYGRGGPAFVEAVDRLNVFASWDLADRYRDGRQVSDSVVAGRQEAARLALSLYELYELTGRTS
ncbi:hypothetical protein ACFV1U_26660 [Streptomyces microflavus]|uniref:hypothetical protein n=1 Tax=Streptomyces microflavus TaxID=1919 RepID=UPI0036D18640